MTTPLPSDFKSTPFNSALAKAEAEVVARNILTILARTGNSWRRLSWKEYKAERKKDGEFTESERGYFDAVIDYTDSPFSAASFAPSWGREARKIAKLGIKV